MYEYIMNYSPIYGLDEEEREQLEEQYEMGYEKGKELFKDENKDYETYLISQLRKDFETLSTYESEDMRESQLKRFKNGVIEGFEEAEEQESQSRDIDEIENYREQAGF